MTPKRKSTILQGMAHRATMRSQYLAWVLARYSQAEQKTDEMMARMLKLPVQDLDRVRICLRPRPQLFEDDIGQVAAKFGLDGSALAKIVRYVDSVQGMSDLESTASKREAGLLLAARARQKNAIVPTQRNNRGSGSK
jgi:hypothetical protein